MIPDELRWKYAGYCCVACISAWLLYSAMQINIETEDGYSTIVNAQYFLGTSSEYMWQRGPMMGLLMVPAEWIAQQLDLHPMDVRPHHILMATLHSLYLLITWLLLTHIFGTRTATLLGFLVAIPSQVFFNYSPFISHDILPGLIALGMLMLSVRFQQSPSLKTWIHISLLASCAALIKQTYGLLSASLVLSALAWHVSQRKMMREDLSIVIGLALSTLLSGCIAWLGYSFALAGLMPEENPLIRPWIQIRGVVEAYQHTVETGQFYQWVYLRNLSAYGITLMLLILPGLYCALRSKSLLFFQAAVIWIAVFAAMHFISFKEVRYLAYLAPVSAMLATLVIDRIASIRKLYLIPVIGLLLIDIGKSIPEIQRVSKPFYQTSIPAFLSSLPVVQTDQKLYMSWRLSFIAPMPYTYFGDRFHRIFNVSYDHIQHLYGYPDHRLLKAGTAEKLLSMDISDGDILIFANDVAARVPPFTEDNRTSLHDGFVQLTGRATLTKLSRKGSMLMPDNSQESLLMIILANGHVLISPTGFDAETVTGAFGIDKDKMEMELIMFDIKSYCDLRGCSS